MGGIDDFLKAAEDPAFVRVATARVLPPEAVPLLRLHAELEAQWDETARGDAELNRDPELPVLAEKVRDVERQLDEAKVEFRFRCIGTSKWLALSSKHPPTPEQTKLSSYADHNPDTFQPAAVALSCQDPEMSVEQAEKLRDVLTVEQWAELWRACREANMGGGDSPKSPVAGAILRVRDRLGTTAALAASLDQSSSDE